MPHRIEISLSDELFAVLESVAKQSKHSISDEISLRLQPALEEEALNASQPTVELFSRVGDVVRMMNGPKSSKRKRNSTRG